MTNPTPDPAPKPSLPFGKCPPYCDRPWLCPVHWPGSYGNEAGYEDRGT